MDKIRDRLLQITIDTLNKFKQDEIDQESAMRTLNDIIRRRNDNHLSEYIKNQQKLQVN